MVDLIFRSWPGKQTLSAGIICPMPGSVLSILIATTTWYMKQLLISHLTHGETEAQKGESSCSVSHSQEKAGLGWEPR